MTGPFLFRCLPDVLGMLALHWMSLCPEGCEESQHAKAAKEHVTSESHDHLAPGDEKEYMLLNDTVKLALSALSSQRLRSFLTALGICVGIAAVVLLTSLGEGIHRFVLSEFTQFGTNLIAVTPGKTTTTGMSGALISNVRPMSMEDALALERILKVKDRISSVVSLNSPFNRGHFSAALATYGLCF